MPDGFEETTLETERVDNFKYLGSLVTSQNETETDIKDKIAMGTSRQI
jgi:hypothetical protein